ncbi:MAG: nuclease [Gammaproteobacteria bacterium]|nr:MAG: nuclease [Gammaproteobacteria bacterium]
MLSRTWKNRLLSRTTYLLLSSMAVVVIAWWTAPLRRPAPPAADSGMCTVTRVIDGDTLIATCHGQKHKLRLMHIDAPELAQQPWGQRAKQALAALAQTQIWVDFHGQDVYQRDLAEVYSADKTHSINQALVEQGMARVYRRYQPPTTLLDAMKNAKQQGIGIWQQSGLQQNPQRFRRLAN